MWHTLYMAMEENLGPQFWSAPETGGESTNMAERVKSHLLSIGGTEVSGREGDLTDRPDYLSRGVLTQATKSNVVKMTGSSPNSCHWNCARLHESEDFNGNIETGFALGGDDIWRPHSWMRHSSGKIWETTGVSHKAYFGVPLSTSEADEFAFDNF